MKKLYLLLTALSFSSVIFAQPANNDCSGAIQLTPSASSTCSSPVQGDVTGATLSPGGLAVCTNSNANDDVWYRFTATATSHVISVLGAAEFDAVFTLYSGSCGALTQQGPCVDERGDGKLEENVFSSLVVGQQYYIRVYDYDGDIPATPTFNICVSAPPASVPGCTTNISPANGATNVSYLPGVTFSWNAVPQATQYNIYINGSLTGNTTGTSITLGSFAPNTTYTWYVAPLNALGEAVGCSSNATTFTTGPVPATPSNNECSGAITLSAYGGAINATTISATGSGGVLSCTGPNTNYGTPDDDVWFRITAVQNGNATITITGASTFDAVVQVFSGACGSLSIFQDCTDATGAGGTENVVLNGLTAGQSYYIRVYDWEAGIGDNFTIAVAGAALPVTYAEFSGRKEGNLNLLSWKTISESNNKGFEIERSADGKSFTSISHVRTKAENGNSAAPIYYTYRDAKPLAGSNYYRLKQIDIDGRSTYSDIVLLKSSVIDFRISSIYPNPAKAEVKLMVTATKAERATIIITDLSGKVVSQKGVQLVVGENLQQVNINYLSTGTYLIKAVSVSGETGVQKFIKN
jgi:hypothetical protein